MNRPEVKAIVSKAALFKSRAPKRQRSRNREIKIQEIYVMYFHFANSERKNGNKNRFDFQIDNSSKNKKQISTRSKLIARTGNLFFTRSNYEEIKQSLPAE